LRLGLRLNRTILRLLGTVLRLLLLMPELWLLRLLGTVLLPLLKLVRTLLLRLDGARLGLAGADLRLWRLNGVNLRLVGLIGPVVGLFGPELGLARAVVGVHGLTGTDYGLTRGYIRLAGAGWLYLRPVVWFTWAIPRFAWTIPLLAGTGFGLAGTGFGLAGTSWRVSRIRSRVGACEAWLRGDWPGGCDHGWAASVHVVELLAILFSFALMLDLRRHGRDSGTAHGFNFSRAWSDDDAASAPVVGDAGVVVDHNGSFIYVTNTGADAIDGAVVVEVVSAPIAAVVAKAGVAKAVVDATVVADVRAPEAAVEAPASVVPAPVAGGP
jgi:hypothetical protein